MNGDQIPGVELMESTELCAQRRWRVVRRHGNNVRSLATKRSPPEPQHHGICITWEQNSERTGSALGFGAVIGVVIFAGLLLRYGFSTSYKGRSNQLRLRYKLMRRGDQ